MKISYKIAGVALVAATALAVLPGYNNAQNEALPQSWTTLPEEAPAQKWKLDNAGIEQAENTQGAERAVERFLNANVGALEGLNISPDEAKDKWGLAGYMVDLSVTRNGTIGGLVAKGEASATVYWRPTAAIARDRVVTEQSNADVVVTSETTPEQLSLQLEPVAKTIFASGRVKSSSVLRSNLEKTANQFLEMTRGLNFNPGTEWDVSKLSLDFGVDAEGHISPFFSKGAGVHLRFEWQPSQSKVENGVASSDNSGLKKLVSIIGQDLSAINYDEYAPTGFELKDIRFGIGAYGEGKWGLAKASTSVTGHVYFSRRANATGNVTFDDTKLGDTITVVEHDPLQTNIQYAQEMGIPFMANEKDGKRAEAAYEVVRENFRKGMQKASKMALFVAGRPSKTHQSKWAVSQLRTEYALSLSGTTSFVTLSGLKTAFEFRLQQR